MTDHIFHKCNNLDCNICEGGLALCKVCGGVEGSLTTECCEKSLTAEQHDRIYFNRDLDFKNGQWINEPSSIWKKIK